AGAGVPPSGLAVEGAVGVMLRVTGAAPLFSKVREPRLPMLELDDFPLLENELPARASARVGASARARQKNSDSRMRHCSSRCPEGDRLNMAMSVRKPADASAVQYGASLPPAEEPHANCPERSWLACIRCVRRFACSISFDFTQSRPYAPCHIS